MRCLYDTHWANEIQLDKSQHRLYDAIDENGSVTYKDVYVPCANRKLGTETTVTFVTVVYKLNKTVLQTKVRQTTDGVHCGKWARLGAFGRAHRRRQDRLEKDGEKEEKTGLNKTNHSEDHEQSDIMDAYLLTYLIC